MVRCREVGGRWLGLALLLSALTGCGGPKVYPVKGKLVFDKGDVSLLAGSTLYCQHENEPVQAFGDINDDGSFTLQMRTREGRMLPGAVEGTYWAWIVLNTDNGTEESQFRKLRIDPKYLAGNKSSTLTFKVPTTGDVVLTVTPGKPGARLPGTEPPASKSGAPSCDGRFRRPPQMASKPAPPASGRSSSLQRRVAVGVLMLPPACDLLCRPGACGPAAAARGSRCGFR
jgi:hypothetical protein